MDQSKLEPENYKIYKDDDMMCLIFKPGSLSTFPVSDFQSLGVLTYLGLSGNNLVEIGKEIFTAFPLLKWLDLRDNKLISFPGFVNHENLETLLLGSNNLRRLPIELGSFMQLSSLQASDNPLEFPNDDNFLDSDCDIITFLRLCWKQKTEKPDISFKNGKKVYHNTVKKAECLQPVKQFRNVSNVLVDKIHSNDPIDQVLAEHVTRKLRHIEKQLQKVKDREALKSWREKYMGHGVAKKEREDYVPFGIDEEYSRMMTRRELHNFRTNMKSKKSIVKRKKPSLNIDEELMKLQESLGKIKNRQNKSDFCFDMSQKMVDLKEINDIQKRIKSLQMIN
ncbi:leucine-rich repeat-containing protein 59 [Halyomorpha halys]|uniref:leucine-rich repeat-containing protein 59 n=1 Tax=Halyomorpha halys TaxID=286706 RepID=UPI0006D4E1A9|nr:uncharacterized protein LOC106678339 [Halyomorpha halys]XP_024214966.1 uncharacterized protein LOC106678339 [Halyomorpha halys]